MATITLEKAARLADVAKAAGVSQGTVSNVFNRPNLVREEVREHVRSVAKQIGYRGPDPKGRLLRAGKVNAIGVATVEPLGFFFTDPFARVLMTGVTEACDAEGAGISLVSAASEEELTWNVRSALVDGFLLFCLEGADRLIRVARERQLPFVALALGHRDESVSAVGIDNVSGARDVARHLAELGHRRFAVLGLQFRSPARGGPVKLDEVAATSFSASGDRVRGYFEALATYGIDTAAIPIYETVTEQHIRSALEKIFAAPEPPTALIAEADRIAFVAMEWLRERGLRVPAHVSIVGFDGVPESAKSEPPLTTVVQPIAEIGRRAVRMILEHGNEVRRESLPVEMVIRSSTAPPKS